jgi:CubicO group peptidase (beta-lactamase class C family)
MRNLDAFLADLNREFAFPALVAAVTDRMRLTALGATGVRHIGEATTVDAADPFHIGSVTKPITSAMIASLVTDGLLGFDSTPAQVLDVAVHAALRDVPLRSYLAHRAGSPRSPTTPNGPRSRT